jgi:hypothetical protein
MKFEKTANLANIASLTSGGMKQTNSFNAEGRYKKKNSETEQNQEKKKSSQSGRNTNSQVKNTFSLTAGSAKL